MTNRFKTTIAKLAPHTEKRGSSYNWDCSGYAFDENFLERKAKKIIQAEKARAKWHAKKTS